jgi:DNA-binding transcriptional LysR family regulator
MIEQIELRHLRYFVAVAEELHFGRAARRLHLAQPPLSQQIKKLEEMLGHTLFTRTSRAVKLTSAGELLFERARAVLRKVQEDIEDVRSVGRGEVGSLKVGFVGTAMLTAMPAILSRYRREYPNVDLQLREFYTSGVESGLRDGSIDVGFLRDGGKVAGLEVETLLSEPFVAVVPARHPLAKRKTISAAMLREEGFVLFTPLAGRTAYEKTASLCEAHGFRPHVVQEAPQWLTILRLVGAGLGVSIGPACVSQIATSGVVCLKLRSAVKTDIEIAHREADGRALVSAFCAIARVCGGYDYAVQGS